MIQIIVSDTIDNVVAGLVISQKQRAYAVSNSINAVMKLIQKEQRQRIKSDINVRKNKFMERQVAIIKPFSRHSTQMAKISIGKKPRLQLSGFELGGTQRPRDGASNISSPVLGGARSSGDVNVPKSMYIKGFQLKKVGKALRGSSSRGSIYVIRGVGIFLRTGGGRSSGSKMLYAFNRTQQFNKRLHWRETCERVTRDEFARVLNQEVTIAMNIALVKGAAAFATSAVVGGLVKSIFDSFGNPELEPEDLDELESD